VTSQISPEKLSLDRPITTAGQLLVEGRVPEMFFREMIAAYGLLSAVEVRTFGDVSKENLQTYLEVFAQKAVFKEKVTRLGVIRDAERSSAASAFQSVQAALRGAGLPVPNAINGLEGTPLAVGIFILPDCEGPGMLEDLCLHAIAEAESSATTAFLPCVDEFFACLAKQKQKPENTGKARFAGYALARDVIDPQLGRAAQKGAIPWSAKVFGPLRAFLSAVGGGR
jgi:hypothetical protein